MIPDRLNAVLDAAVGEDIGARAYLLCISRLVQIADDLTDETLPFVTRQDYMMQLLDIALVQMPFNPFYQRYAHVLAPLIATVLVTWRQSDTLKMTGDMKRQMFGFVRRENIDGLVVAVAAIVGGMDRAERVSDMLMDGHAASGESLEDWIAEGRP